jgi:hypothetical protein
MTGEQLALFSEPTRTTVPMIRPQPPDDDGAFWRSPEGYAAWRSRPLCVDCRIELLPDTLVGACDWQRYIVHDHVWHAAGMDRGWICIDCSKRACTDRSPGPDFPDLLINDPDWDDEDTPRLKALKRSAAQHWNTIPKGAASR